MTREEANQVLDRWKLGIAIYPQIVITHALYVTGDLHE
jgi:hypothetical protein